MNWNRYRRALLGVMALMAVALLSLSCAAPLEPPAMPATAAPVSYDVVTLAGVPPTGWFEGDTYLRNPDLDTVKQRMGRLFVPSYLPDGFKLVRAFVSGNWGAYLDYTHSVTCSAATLRINVTAGSADFKFPDGMAEKVTVNGNPAYLIHGNWVSAPMDAPDVWVEGEALQLVFSLGGQVIYIQGIKADAWTGAELIKIAESLHEL